jgi:hypothetical protein
LIIDQLGRASQFHREKQRADFGAEYLNIWFVLLWICERWRAKKGVFDAKNGVFRWFFEVAHEVSGGQ